jgi:hypothetical protein
MREIKRLTTDVGRDILDGQNKTAVKTIEIIEAELLFVKQALSAESIGSAAFAKIAHERAEGEPNTPHLPSTEHTQ